MDKQQAAAEVLVEGDTSWTQVHTGTHPHAVLSSDAPCQHPPADPPWRNLDRLVQASLVRSAGGISPIGLYLDCLDWAMHLAVSPGKQMSIWDMAKSPALEATPPANRSSLVADPRFKHPDWEKMPYRQFRDAFQRMEACWEAAASGVSGATPKHQNVVRFVGRQVLDLFSPSNVWWVNPEVLGAMSKTNGMSLLLGMQRMQADAADLLTGNAPGASEDKREHFRVGKDLAVTPGCVVFANPVMELIRYAPASKRTYPEPVLIVPSWLLKYYILDLSARNSLVRYLVEAGHTVYMMSWKNPREEGRDWGLATYLEEGVFAALQHIYRELGGKRVHTAGYCLGGTLLAMAAAALGRQHSRRPWIKTVTLLAAQTDFSEPGELGLFISSSGVSGLDALMWQQGFLDGKQLAGVFQLLNSRDLIWSRLVHDYLLGRQLTPTAMMAWNADTTRLPYRLHSEMLHDLYLHNNLAEGRQCIDGEPVTLTDIHVPMLVVATERDHISPWRSVHKLHLLTHREMTFVLVSGGHNVGIVSPPGEGSPHQHYRWKVRRQGDPYLPPQDWTESAALDQGSWWPFWQGWLGRHSGARSAAPAYPPGRILSEAPGTYVLER
ncbi:MULTISPECIES: alpha/beta fold hydrolase [unclassified Achromobacter]|uniref:alpha/beta fold hydrolase n=1 Tax=unclassified Achromobacter TaxID=2626865 RepID=UPI000B51C7E6|nr:MULTISPECIES: alpha/beta fold hydrolase [unclassified Achromobacter]OWT74696.1 poly-beta-hydroxybutyrate polymerase [Achromobacter sp. HZ34]OWT79163.1 poly-beta-hydroxybutyrate polymerase [Achromobacter sp. HZ28]